MLMHEYSLLDALSRVLSGKMTPPDPGDPIDISGIDVCYIVQVLFRGKGHLY